MPWIFYLLVLRGAISLLISLSLSHITQRGNKCWLCVMHRQLSSRGKGEIGEIHTFTIAIGSLNRVRLNFQSNQIISNASAPYCHELGNLTLFEENDVTREKIKL
eukprot:sb/3477965/